MLHASIISPVAGRVWLRIEKPLQKHKHSLINNPRTATSHNPFVQYINSIFLSLNVWYHQAGTPRFLGFGVLCAGTVEELQRGLSPGLAPSLLQDHYTLSSSLCSLPSNRRAFNVLLQHTLLSCPFSCWEPVVQHTEWVGVVRWIRSVQWIRFLVTNYPADTDFGAQLLRTATIHSSSYYTGTQAPKTLKETRRSRRIQFLLFLNVTVNERHTTGFIRSFTVPHCSCPLNLHEYKSKYSSKVYWLKRR